ncbi:MAG: hypothetical protein QME41_08910 [Actinomycetota bacterium]|nr:hypothetical protein [Actinomycetota bacterium]
MKQRVLGLLVLISVLTLVFTSTSCTSKAKPENTQVDKSKNQNMTATFPKTTFIDDREVRFAVRNISYPKSLPTLSVKTEGFADDEVVGWFTAGGGKAQPKTEILLRTPDLSLSGVRSDKLSNAQPTQEMWDITGEETGTLARENNGGIMFSNPKEYRSYGILPKGIMEPDVKMIFARDMITEKDAVEGTEAYVESHGGIPEDARRKATPGTSNIRIVKNGKMVDPVGKTLWYSITYDHRFRDIPIESDKIEIVIDALGVARYSRAWHTIHSSGKPQTIVSPEEAVAAAVKRYAPKI